MKKTLKMILTLVIIAGLSGAVLAKVYEMTESKIKNRQKELIEESIFAVLPDTDSYKKETHGELEIFRSFNKDKKPNGIAFIASGTGYQGVIKVIVGVTSGLSEIKGIKILKDEETPGLGARINEKRFNKQFIGLKTGSKIEVVKEEPKDNQIQAITGATVSSEAVVSIVNENLNRVKEILKSQRCPK